MMVFANVPAPISLAWDWAAVWDHMSGLGQSVVILLGLMLVHAVVIMVDRVFVYRAARIQSVRFVRDVTAALDAEDLQQAISIAERNADSHVAQVVVAGLLSFISAPLSSPNREAIEAAERALNRSRARVHAEFKAGLAPLATIASVAPFVGLFGTVVGLLNAFTGVAMQKHAYTAFIALRMSEALLTTAGGLLVAVAALWFHNYLCTRLDIFDREASNASLELITFLHGHQGFRHQLPCDAHALIDSWMCTEGKQRAWEVPYDRHEALLFPIWLFAIVLFAQLANATFRALYWRLTQQGKHSVQQVAAEYDAHDSNRIRQKVAMSPDGRFRAVVPAMVRQRSDITSQGRGTIWECDPHLVLPTADGQDYHLDTEHRAGVFLMPNNSSMEWKRVEAEFGRLSLSHYRVLLAQNCNTLTPVWRTNDELLVQCSDCSPGDLQMNDIDLGTRRITIIGPNGKRLRPRKAGADWRGGENRLSR